MKINIEKVLETMHELSKRYELSKGMQPELTLSCYLGKQSFDNTNNDLLCKKCKSYKSKCLSILNSFEYLEI